MTTETATLKRAAAEKSLEFIQDGNIVGLGTGTTVRYLLEALAVRVKEGLRIQGVPTSRSTAALATELHIPILSDDEAWDIDVAIDGADEVDPHFNLIKGGGGALLREKIIASTAKKFVVIVDHAKLVTVLGSSFPLPVEVTPFGWPNTVRQIEHLGYQASPRQRDGKLFVTDNQNYILDLHGGTISNPWGLTQQLNAIPGVVENGLFVGLTSALVVASPQGISVRRSPAE
ncbi:MAG: ribose-5-phosphate isomerase RpiA [Nitrospirales bacterium]|nr:ribose-5-phosphate isomerase RpiA [Nitrospirales bacterium]